MGLARLFGQDTDEASLESVLGDDFDPATILGARVTSGRTILQSVFDPQFPCTYAALLRDRGECCQKRQAWPKRPTEICPFGVLDIEAMLRFPEQASFAYPSSIGFNPTEDALLLEAIIAYHCWYD
jgi:hypothetical protein